jgi:hypothetical protein
MHPSKLIGKKVLRTKAHQSTGSRSFMDGPITILTVTDSHILYRWEGSFRNIIPNPDEPCILASDYLDDNWTSYDDLMALIDPKIHIKLMAKLKYWIRQTLAKSKAIIHLKSWLNKLSNWMRWSR